MAPVHFADAHAIPAEPQGGSSSCWSAAFFSSARPRSDPEATCALRLAACRPHGILRLAARRPSGCTGHRRDTQSDRRSGGPTVPKPDTRRRRRRASAKRHTLAPASRWAALNSAQPDKPGVQHGMSEKLEEHGPWRPDSSRCARSSPRCLRPLRRGRLGRFRRPRAAAWRTAASSGASPSPAVQRQAHPSALRRAAPDPVMAFCTHSDSSRCREPRPPPRGEIQHR
jgi:hypothetical protein